MYRYCVCWMGLGVLAGVGCAGKTGDVRGVGTDRAASLIPREAVFGDPERTAARVSPDGAMISWLAPHEGVLNVWVAPVESMAQARVVTRDTYRGIRTYEWSRDSKAILFLQDEGGDENYHVYRADIQADAVIDLTPVKPGARAVIQGSSSKRPADVLVATNERNPQLFDLYRVNHRTGERTLVQENPGYASWITDNDLQPRFGLKPDADRGFTVVDMEGRVLTRIPGEDALTTQSLGMSGSNAQLYLLDSRDRDKSALVKIEIATGAVSVVAASDKADVGNTFLHPSTGEPLAYAVDYLKARWTGLNDAMRRDLAFLRSKLGDSFEIVSASDDLRRMVVYSDASTSSGVYSLYDRDGASLVELFETRPALKNVPLQQMHPREIKSRDGLTLVSYLTLPVGTDLDGDGTPAVPQPMVLWVHGGPWGRDRYGYNSVHQWLADRGYAVLSVNYRGSTGFGKRFTNAAVQEFAGKMHDDLIDAVRWAVDQGIADPRKVAIGGGSYGGYATLVGVAFTPETFACGVDIVGPSSLVTLIESFPAYWKPYLDVTWYKYVGDPEDPKARADMLARSAISRIDAISVPLLVGQGENDPRVTKKESDQLVEAMAEKKLPVTYVNFPDEGHGFARPENRLAFFAVMEGFLTGCLGGQAESLGESVEKSTMQVLHGAEHVPGLN